MGVFELLKNNFDKNGIYFVEEHSEDSFISYKELLTRAYRHGETLRKLGLKEGDKAIVCCKKDKEVILNFWACILWKIVPTILPYIEKETEMRRAYSVWKKLGKTYILTDDATDLIDIWNRSEVVTDAKECNIAEYVIDDKAVFEDFDTEKNNWDYPDVKDDCLFMLQFSSGSTGTPKGVILNYGNIHGEVLGTVNYMNYTSEDVFASWKPLSHDYGLIYFHILPMLIGATQVRIALDVFLSDPMCWIDVINKYRVDVTAAPNFGYRLLAEHFDDKRAKESKWDLSCLKQANSGGERVSAQALRDFAEMLGPYGFNEIALSPEYGLAENTLHISTYRRDEKYHVQYLNKNTLGYGDKYELCSEGDDKAVELVSVGRIIDHSKARIVYDEEEVYDRIGEIQVSGPCVVEGYLDDEEESAKLKTADGWLHTGDLGFIHDGVLTVTGRLKELIIIGGKNISPFDVEEILKAEITDKTANDFGLGSVLNEQTGLEEIAVFVEYTGELSEFKELSSRIKKVMNLHLGLVPGVVVPVNQFPRTKSCKIQRNELVKRYLAKEYDVVSEKGVKGASQQYADKVLESVIREEIEDVTGLSDIGYTENLMDAVSGSYALMVLIERISSKIQIKLNPTLILEDPTIRGLVNLIKGNKKEESSKDDVKIAVGAEDTDIAIIGIALSFPGGVRSSEDYWNSLIDNKCLLQKLPSNRWKEYNWNEDEVSTTTGGFVDGVEYFDASFFGISGVEAQEMDPQQRLLLELCWKAIENAGYAPAKLKGKEVGVFVGISNNDYFHMEKDFNSNGSYVYTGNMFNSAAGRISYIFDLKGPSMAIDTACSSAIYSIKQACLAMNDEECNSALVGAVNLMLSPDLQINFSGLGALSPNGKCRTFDMDADGYVRSEGGAVFVLKKLSKAKADKDRILGVIKSCVVNHNGRTGGFTVPSGEAQAKMILDAIKRAHLTVDDIDYVEAHGTGTRVGDPQELYALQRVFEKKKNKLKIGSVKTNLGHLESASGMASIAKVLLSMQHNEIPASLFFKSGNPLFDWKASNLSVVSENEQWSKTSGPHYAGITSLGISGSNGHIILESYENKQTPAVDNEDNFLLKLSVQSRSLIPEYLGKLKDWADKNEYGLGDICRNLAQREELRYRCSVVVKKNMNFKTILGKIEKRADDLFRDSKKSLPITFIFSGQGSQYEKMGLELYQKSVPFRKKMDEIFEILERDYHTDLKKIIFGDEGLLEKRPLYTQMAIFAVQVSLCEYWKSLNVRPNIIMGHSIGEFAALHIAGGINLENAVKLLYHRAVEVENIGANGKMIALLTNLEKAKSIVAGIENAYISVINTDENITVSGTGEAVDKVGKAARAESIIVEELSVYFPFHSELMRDVADKLKAVFDDLQTEPLSLPFYSTIEKKWYDPGEKLESSYWYEHLLKPVCFADSVKEVLEDETAALEIGANAVVSGIISQILGRNVVIPSQRKGMELIQIMDAAGKLWENGIEVSSDTEYNSEDYQKIYSLPNTLFNKKYYWITKKDSAGRVNTEFEDTVSDSSIIQISESPKYSYESGSVKDRIYGILCDLLYVDNEELNDTDAFFSFGMDSLRLFQLKNRVMNDFQVEVGIKELFSECNSIGKLSAFVEEKQGSIKDTDEINDGTNGTGLSREEKGIFFISQGVSGNRAYQNVRTIDFADKIDPNLVKEKVRAVIRRHDLLQCVYRTEETDVVHYFEDREPEYIETTVTDEAGHKALYDLLLREFDFSNAPLWRWAFYEDADGKDHAVFVFHHIIADHHATDIFIKELEAAFSDSELDRTLSYGDYIKLQENRGTDSSRQWWKQQMDPVPERLAFDVNHNSSTLDRHEGKTLFFHITDKNFQKTKEIIEDKQTTAFSFFLTVWAVVLSKMGRRKRFVVGTPFDHRVDGNFSNTLGNFVDSLPILVDVDRSVSFAQLIGKMQTSCFESVEHSDCLFDTIVSDLGIKPEKDSSPLFNVLYTYVNDQRQEYSFGETKGILSYMGNGYTTHELTIGMIEHLSEVMVKFDFSSMYFEEEKAQEYVEEFNEVLGKVVDNVDIQVNELLSMSGEQYDEILKLSCGEMRDVQGISFRDIMKQSFDKYASSPAIEFGDTSYTYDELAKKVEQAAGELKLQGVEHGDGVAVILPLSPEVIISMLAIQKIGAYWIPLDVAFPKDRTEYVIQKSNAKTIICRDDYAYKNDYGCSFVTIEQILNSKERCEFNSSIDPEDTAYVIFTSGTTGKPKGVELPQRALCNFLIGMKDFLNWESGKRVACMTTPSFDIFLLETMLTLSDGGCVVVAEKDNTISPDRIAKFVEDKRINYLQLTPTRLKMIDVDRESTGKILKQIDSIFIGGEQFPADLLPVLQESGKAIYNVYGPTETCIWSTVKDLTKSSGITIGRPILNTYTYVLDESGNILPPEEEGDLWIGGLGVAKGYINDPKITEDKFKENKFHDGMIYMTGDRAKWVNGELVCLGRSDFQVKIRGYRIELEELEKVILKYPGIHNAAVCVKDQGNGNKTLIAYFEENTPVDKSELKRFMEQKVPKYMVPSGIIAVDRFPTTQSGKVDRKQLLLINQETHETEIKDVGLTERIESIYKSVLGMDEIDLGSSFFDMGGNSFSLIILLKQLNELCDGKLDVTDLFTDSSVLGVSGLISKLTQTKAPQGVLLPEDWNKHGSSSEYAVTTKLSDDTVQKVKAFEEKYKYERECLFGSTLATCISKIMGYVKFGIWVANNERESQFVEFDFSKDNSINGCLNNLKEALDASTDMTDHKQLAESESDDSRLRICIGDMKYTSYKYVQSAFDMLIGYSLEERKVKLQSDFGIEEKKLTELLNSFMYILNVITQKM